DVRIAPGSRRHPQFARAALMRWLPAFGIAYAWAPDLGGRREAGPRSPDTALQEPAFRGYADHMRGEAFGPAIERVLGRACSEATAVMCAEADWRRCHRPRIADAARL